MAPPRKGSTRAEQRKEEDAKRARFLKHKSWFSAELQRQAANRYQMAMDDDYRHNIQWTPDEAAAVRARGQNPVVYNEIAPTLDWLIGTERRTRVDFLVTNRSDDTKEAYEDAQVKTNLLKYLEDVNRTPWERSRAAEDCFTVGLGWLETGVRADPSDEPIFVRYQDWRFMLYDSLGTRLDCEDWRYQFRFQEVDLDIAEAYFPDKVDLLRKATLEAERDSYMEWWNGMPITGVSGYVSGLPQKWTPFDADAWAKNPRERVLLIECWASEPFTDTTGEGAGIYDRIRMRKRVSVMTEFDTLVEDWSPYRHDKFPFIPQWCFRRGRDGAPYGVARRARGPQDMLNKQMSKAQFRLAVNQIITEKGAIDNEVMDADEIRDEANAPDGMVVLKEGGFEKFKIREGATLVEADLLLAQHNIQSIRQGSGVSDESRGINPRARSGKAVLAEQEQGSMVTTAPFDNIQLARQLEGEIVLSLVEQYYTEPKVFSVAGESKRYDYNRINTPDPVTGEVLNDITARKAAFVIGEQPWKQSLAEGAFQSTMELLGQLAPVAPQVVIAILDLVFEMHPNLPKRESILQRVRQVTGQNAPGEEDNPEQMAAKQQQQQIAQAQFQAQMAQMQAAIREAQAKGEKLEADAMGKRLESLYMAAQGAQVLAMAPGITPIADELLKSAGFQDRGGAPGLEAPQAAQALPPEQGGPLEGHMAGSQTARPDGVISQE